MNEDKVTGILLKIAPVALVLAYAFLFAVIVLGTANKLSYNSNVIYLYGAYLAMVVFYLLFSSERFAKCLFKIFHLKAELHLYVKIKRGLNFLHIIFVLVSTFLTLKSTETGQVSVITFIISKIVLPFFVTIVAINRLRDSISIEKKELIVEC